MLSCRVKIGPDTGMNLKHIEDLILKDESEILEFKKSTAKLKGAAETLCAFLNGKGGTVLIGVTDNKKITGQNITDQTRQEIANTLRKFEPTANIEIQYISSSSNKEVIVLTAHPDIYSIPYTFNGRAYERRESSTNLMPQTRYQQLLLSRNINPACWESQPALSISIDNLDQIEIHNTLKDITKKQRLEASLNGDNISDILTRLKLIEAGQITNAAVVLFSKEISGNYIQCVMRMARFRGTKKGDFIDSKHIFGNTFQLLKEAEVFINRNTAVASHFEKGEMARIDEPEYPFKAVREALINAICHREYGSPGSSITLTIYDDRLEITNSGVLPSDITIEDLKTTHTSHPRNPRITNVFFRRGFIEAMGIGTQEIIDSCIAAKMKEPEFYEQAGAFVVKLWSRHYAPNIDESSLSGRQRHILTLLKIKALAPKDILSMLTEKITDRTLRNDLQLLKQKGYVDSSGKGKQTLWFLVKKAEIRK